MTLIRPEGEDGDAKEVLLGVEEHFYEAAEDFKAVVRRLRAGEIVAPAGARDTVSEYRKLATLLFRERQSLEDERRRRQGIHGEYGLDLDAARDEIRRRMACLRAAGAVAGFSE